MVEINELLPLEIPANNEISKELREMFFNLDITYYELVKGSSASSNQVRLVSAINRVPSSIASRIPKKSGKSLLETGDCFIGCLIRTSYKGKQCKKYNHLVSFYNLL